MQKRTLLLAVAAVMAVIAGVDYILGPTAEYLNGYEILRRTVGLGLPQVSEQYVLGQHRLGSLALAWGWLLWIVEALVIVVATTRVATLLSRRVVTS